MDWSVPRERRHRVIIDTDAKNEADDQFAIVHALLTPSFDIAGIVPAHFGTSRTPASLQESHDEVMLLLELMGMTGRVRVEDGAPRALPDERTPLPSPGVQLIIDEAMRDDGRPLYLAFLGPLTDMASALLLEPRMVERDVRVIWLGGGMWPAGSWEFNLSNDVAAANVVFRSGVKLSQIPMNAWLQARVSYAELFERVFPHGKIGRYLVEQLIAWDESVRPDRTYEVHVLCDSTAIGVMVYPLAGDWEWQQPPQFTAEMLHAPSEGGEPIRVYKSIDSRFVFEDFYAKLGRFARDSGPR